MLHLSRLFSCFWRA